VSSARQILIRKGNQTGQVRIEYFVTVKLKDGRSHTARVEHHVSSAKLAAMRRPLRLKINPSGKERDWSFPKKRLAEFGLDAN